MLRTMHLLPYLKNVLFWNLLLFSWVIKSQDPQFSHVFSTAVYNNPAFTGLCNEARVSLDTRVLWSSLPGAYTTQLAVADYFAEEASSGFGLMLVSDKSGGSVYRNTGINGLYAYELPLNQKWTLRAGAAVAYYTTSVDLSQLTFMDEQPLAGTSNGGFSKSYVDINTGGLLYSDALWLSVGVSHVTRPSMSYVGNFTNKLPMRISASGGAKLLLKEAYGSYDNSIVLLPTFHLNMQGAYKQLDMGTYFKYSALVLGAWYRGLPFVQNFGISQQNALVGLVGFKLEKLGIHYSYDHSLSPVSAISGASHEVSMVYEFGVLKKWSPEQRPRMFVF